MISAQLDMFSAPVVRQKPARGVDAAVLRARGIRQAEASAKKFFRSRVQEGIRHYLAEHGPASSEEMVDALKARGLAPQDDRAFGGAFIALSRKGEIVKHGACLRRKGHLTAGGVVWALAPNKDELGIKKEEVSEVAG
jgi:hypothetical protein